MAKTLGKLRQQTAKLRELEAPSDVSKGTKAFVRKHVYVVHPDANENDDDVFKATNVKRAKRAPDHGYEPGQDADIYEGKMKDVETDQEELRLRKNRAAHADRSILGDQGMKDTEGTQFAKAQSDFDKAHGDGLRKWPGFANAARSRRSNRRAITKAGLTNSYEPQGNKIDEIFGKKTLKLGGREAPQDPAQKEWMRTHPANEMVARGNVARPNVRRNPVIAQDLATMQANMQANKALQRNSYDPAGDYEHIAELSESDQSLLVDIYNSLTEDNQDRFLEIAETPEGVDKLLDFAITNSKGIK